MVRFSLVLGLVLVLAPDALAAQAGGFPVLTFRHRDSTAMAILAYDRCSWVTTDEHLRQPRDEIMARGPIGLCYQDDAGWHGVYGAWDDATSTFTPGYHYRIDETGVALVHSPIDTSLVRALGHGLVATLKSAPDFTRQRARFNGYVFSHGDTAVVAWLLPAWQPDGTALVGAEAMRIFTWDGTTLLHSTEVEGPLRAVRPDSAAVYRVTSNSGDDSPTVGELFFVRSFLPHFRRIWLDSRHYTSMIATTDGQQAWYHARRDAVAEPQDRGP